MTGTLPEYKHHISADDSVSRFFENVILEEMLECAAENSKEWGQQMDIEYSGDSAFPGLLLNRIMSSSNLIAVNCRRGPASYVIMSPAAYNLLPNIGSGLIRRPAATSSIAGLEILLCDSISSTVLIGRKAGVSEPGIYFSSEEITSRSVVNHEFILRFGIGRIGSGPMPYTSFVVHGL